MKPDSMRCKQNKLNESTASRLNFTGFRLALFTLTLFSLMLITRLQAAELTHSEFERIETLTQTSNILQLQQAMDDGKLTSVQLTQFYLQQIDKKNPQLNAIISILPNALANAQMLDKERSKGMYRGDMHGIPIVVKDNIETRKLATTAGSLALKDNITKRDATVIKKLKRAGAIILAKSNLSEWANFRTERSSSGWSAIGGQTRNPIDVNRSACGSSSGSAVAVAANLAVAAVGTETDGSITCPASATGTVGIKPTVGLVSRYRIIPIAETQDTAGPIAKSVIDAAILLEAMQGKDNADLATKARKFDFDETYKADTSEFKLGWSLNGLRIGLLESRVNPHEAVDSVYQKAIAQLEHAGAIIVPNLKTENYAEFRQDSYDVLLYEFKNGLNRYFKTLPNSLHGMTLEKLIQFNKDNKATEMPYFEQEIFEKAQAKGSLSDRAYKIALALIQKATREDGLDKLMTKKKLDILISPTLGPAWTIDKINGDHYSGGYSSYSAISGYPYLTLPMGKVKHLPIGLSVIGLALDDAKIIAIAKQMEVLFNGDTLKNK
ncbi:MAG: amidase [Polaribacter sp.]